MAVVTLKDILKAVSDWEEREFGNRPEWVFDEDGNLIAGEPIDKIPLAYSQYDNDIDGERVIVDEQWYLDAERGVIWLALNDEVVECDSGFDYEELLTFFGDSTFEELIGEADEYIEEHYAEHKEEWKW